MNKDNNVARENNPVTLPADCIYEIIQYFVNDVKTLHSCIVLNQTFCQISIRILWSNPFKYVQDEIKRSLIFQTYFSCLDDEEKEQITTFLKKSVSYFPKPFINYPSFLQEFEINDIQASMKTFLRQYYSAAPTENRINSIVRILNPFIEKLLFNEQSNFKYVNIDLNYHQVSVERNQIDMSSFDNEILERVLSNIKKFSFGFNFKFDTKKMEFLKYVQRNASILTNIISNHNKDIQHVRFSFTLLHAREHRSRSNKLIKIRTEYDKLLEILKSFILSLNNLKSIETHCFSKNFDFAKLFIKHSHSLVYLKLHDIYSCSIVLSIIDRCPNLRTIELTSFYFNGAVNDVDVISVFDKPITTTLNHLKNLYVKISHSPVLKLFERIVLMSNNGLKTLFYGRQDIYSPFINHNVTPTIQPLCANLTHLFIIVTAGREFSCTISFMKSLQHLVHLKLSCSNSLKDDAITELALSFSQSLKILEMDFLVVPERLKVLLENVRCDLKEINIYARINDAILRVIMDYAIKKNSLKKFRYVNDKSLKIVQSPLQKAFLNQYSELKYYMGFFIQEF
ncbi:hypothetical protein GLOIN_2v1498549 [Rhizophagus clarus]|uniref:F-box domain-containing protein n=1 Tax=Rhizophagus clarus TaxID=94130 RepID=A0A8H3L5L7_9GLOM|nr:hypothetical protein GLOIN_2v1498549 [Rhizophagus clarus]